MPKTLTIGRRVVGADQPLFLIAGPCAIESAEICFEIAEHLKRLAKDLNILVIFKASFDKANRQGLTSFRGPGLKEGLAVLSEVRKRSGLPILSDVHETQQVEAVSEVLDIIQIPAFLCRQTDLLIAAGQSGKCVNIKKGQFMTPEQMKDAVAKVASTGNEKVLLTERGSCFGYGQLINDMTAITIMQEFAPVVFDVTHSTQRPGAAGGSSGGKAEFGLLLARAAVAAGADGLFIETHPEPRRAKCDAATMLPLNQLEPLVRKCIAIRQLITDRR